MNDDDIGYVLQMWTNAALTWTSVLRHALTILVHTLVTVLVDGLWIMMVTTATVNIYSYAWEKLMIVQKCLLNVKKFLYVPYVYVFRH